MLLRDMNILPLGIFVKAFGSLVKGHGSPNNLGGPYQKSGNFSKTQANASSSPLTKEAPRVSIHQNITNTQIKDENQIAAETSNTLSNRPEVQKKIIKLLQL